PALGDDVEADDAGGQLLHGRVARLLGHSSLPSVRSPPRLTASGRTSRPRSTLCLSERSPMTRRSGGGSRLISVGVARILSSSASSGCSSTSMICSSYAPRSSSLQIGRSEERRVGKEGRCG